MADSELQFFLRRIIATNISPLEICAAKPAYDRRTSEAIGHDFIAVCDKVIAACQYERPELFSAGPEVLHKFRQKIGGELSFEFRKITMFQVDQKNGAAMQIAAGAKEKIEDRIDSNGLEGRELSRLKQNFRERHIYKCIDVLADRISLESDGSPESVKLNGWLAQTVDEACELTEAAAKKVETRRVNSARNEAELRASGAEGYVNRARDFESPAGMGAR